MFLPFPALLVQCYAGLSRKASIVLLFFTFCSNCSCVISPVHFIDLIERIIAEEFRGKEAEFLKATGLTTAHMTTWRKTPDVTPQLKTIERIENTLNGAFLVDSAGRPTAWQRKPSAATGPPPSSAQAKQGVVDEPSDIPASARETYETYEFVGGKMEWLDLPEETRGYYEGLHSLLTTQIDRAIDDYEAGLRDLRAARDAQIRKALSEYEEIFQKKMLGLLPSL